MVPFMAGLLPDSQPTLLLWVMGISTAAFFLTNFVYFKTAKKISDLSLSSEQLPDELI